MSRFDVDWDREDREDREDITFAVNRETIAREMFKKNHHHQYNGSCLVCGGLTITSCRCAFIRYYESLTDEDIKEYLNQKKMQKVRELDLSIRNLERELVLLKKRREDLINKNNSE